MSSPLTILHADLDAFFASVEQRDRPEYRGRPLLVGGSTERGVVAAASYEARAFGCRSAMPMAHALRLCPKAIVIKSRYERYAKVSRNFMKILERYSPLVEAISIDEAFLDISGSTKLFGQPEAIAESIRDAVRSELSLVVSVGVAPTKFCAKVASDIGKPNGCVIVANSELLDFLTPLPVSRLWGVGAVTQKKLSALNLRTLGDVSNYPLNALMRSLGAKLGQHLHRLSRGEDPRVVLRDRQPVSIGQEDTLNQDSADRETLEVQIRSQADRVASRLRKTEKRARVITLKIKFGDFNQITRRESIASPTSDSRVIAGVALRLFAAIFISPRSKSTTVRLTGVSVSGLESKSAPLQLSFDEVGRQKDDRLGSTMDKIAERFSKGALKRAEQLEIKRRPPIKKD